MAKTVTEKTKVKVYNNIFNSVGFETASGRRIELPRNGSFKEVSVEDVDYVLSIAPAMLREGILYIKDVDVRKYLDIEECYEDGSIIASSEIDKILEQKPEELKETLSKASKSVKAEVAKKAKGKKDDLTGGQVRAIEEETKTEIEEKF